jgi:hypothetical protein
MFQNLFILVDQNFILEVYQLELGTNFAVMSLNASGGSILCGWIFNAISLLRLASEQLIKKINVPKFVHFTVVLLPNLAVYIYWFNVC